MRTTASGPTRRAWSRPWRPAGWRCWKNLRFHAGEEANDDAFADALSALGDLYVDDAFSAAHRAHASTEAVARRLPDYAGLSLARELEAL